MAKQLHKYMDTDVIAFLEEKMKSNTQHYQSDFDLDRDIILQDAQSQRKEDKNLLWMSRPSGTHCLRESEAFIRDTSAHNTWCFYAGHADDSIIAYAVELTGIKNSTVRGNLYELDYAAHAALVASKAVLPLDCEKVFQDGFVDRVALERSSYWYYAGLVDAHGSIVDSHTFPRDRELHSMILAEQKAARDKMPAAEFAQTKPKPSLSEQIKSANLKTGNSCSSFSRSNELELR